MAHDLKNIKIKLWFHCFSSSVTFAVILGLFWFFLSGRWKAFLITNNIIDPIESPFLLIGSYVLYWFFVWVVYLIFGMSMFCVWILRKKVKEICFESKCV